ncbi:MAG: S8 family serine peptidase [Muribaculaceae bacterium]|nr:S8 family serine peptidase [Muribaculaceae bacterium]
MKRFVLLLILISFVLFPSASITGAEREAPFIPRIVKINSEADLDSLTELGVDILRRRGDILLCLFPNRNTRGGEAAMRPRRHVMPALDVAKSHFGAFNVQNGSATGTPYTGKGVVVGLCDIGIDPLHPTFLDAYGNSRIKRVVQYVEEEGIRIQLDGDDDYLRWKTDNPDMYHATHVCGILAGGGAGTPYAGIASDAEIVATVSTLTEVGLLAGVEDIIDYAKEVGKPAVINISVGSYTGAHDGSSLFSQYLDMCAEDAVIVLSSGNEGSKFNTLSADYTPGMESVSFRLGNTAWDEFRMYGLTDIWSGSASPLSVSIGAYDSDEKRMLKWLDPIILDEKGSFSYLWEGDDANVDSLPFEGELVAEGGIDPENGRFRVALGYEFISPEPAANGKWARYELAVRVSGKPGNDVEVYSDGTYTRLMGMPGSPAPTSQRTVSDLACGFNVISVGMYGNRDSVPYSHPAIFQDDEIYLDATGYHGGATVLHSSYGTLRDGRVTPLTVAPGAPVVSAASRHFHELYPLHPHLSIDGVPWIDESGTSMSSPYVAGYIATWLEAVPTLTSADVRRIIAETNRIDIAEPEDPHNGTGYFDPVGGLRLAMKYAGIEDITDDGLLPDEYVEVYDVAGVKRYAGAASGLSGMERGVYVVRTATKTFKKVVKG